MYNSLTQGYRPMSPNPFLVTDPVQNLSYDPSRNVTEIKTWNMKTQLFKIYQKQF